MLIVTRRKLSLLSVVATALLSACTTGEVLRPDVDVGTTQALPPRMVVQPELLEPQAPRIPQSTVQSGAPVLLVTPNGNVPAPPEVQEQYLQQAAVPNVQSPNVSIDSSPGLEPRQEKPGMLAQLAAIPGNMVPNFLKPKSSDPETQCRRELERLGVTFEDVSPVANGGSCGVGNPVRVSQLAGNITIKPAAILNCKMALAFAEWVKEDVQPAARLRYWSGVNTIEQLSSYSCRTIGNKKGGRLSEHSFGNAIDIGGLTLNNGTELKVRKPGFFAFRQSGLLNKVRGDACDRFTTVLGPGYDAAHYNHFHLDLMDRRGRTCK